MRSPRYTILIANRKTGAVRRLTVSRRLMAAVFMVIACPPLLLGLGSRGADKAQIEALRVANDTLVQENQSYRDATGELTAQIGSLQTALTQISEQGQLDPDTRRALEKLPATVKQLAIGGPTSEDLKASTAASASAPEGTFGILRSLLGSLESRLQSVKTRIENQQALGRATPSIWPLVGQWTYTSPFGNRKDPFTGLNEFHPGLDISADPGVPVHATADGTVETAQYDGNYGNAVVIAHGFSISTRYGHLSRFSVRAGQGVKRGDVIGYVGATGRVTGAHLHYEILVGGNRINPIGLLSGR
jgi:murein DD-endopeptidase MepM/ murein hydrolase activator NlpD